MNTTLIAWTLVVFAAVLNCGGNLCLKKTALYLQQSESAHYLKGVIDIIVYPWFVGGLALYGINVILFTKSLKELNIAAAYPVLSGFGFVLIAILAPVLLRERKLELVQYIGVLVILLGIFLTSHRYEDQNPNSSSEMSTDTKR